jgi:hypothetical protein
MTKAEREQLIRLMQHTTMVDAYGISNIIKWSVEHPDDTVRIMARLWLHRHALRLAEAYVALLTPKADLHPMRQMSNEDRP